MKWTPEGPPAHGYRFGPTVGPVLLLGLLFGCVWLAGAAAQTLYQYEDEEGNQVFADRPPDGGRDFEQRTLETYYTPPTLRIRRMDTDESTTLLVDNRFHCPILVSLTLSNPAGLSAETPTEAVLLVPARSAVPLLEARPRGGVSEWGFGSRFQYIPGDPTARHRYPQAYRAPFALARRFLVAQAYPGPL